MQPPNNEALIQLTEELNRRLTEEHALLLDHSPPVLLPLDMRVAWEVLGNHVEAELRREMALALLEGQPLQLDVTVSAYQQLAKAVAESVSPMTTDEARQLAFQATPRLLRDLDPALAGGSYLLRISPALTTTDKGDHAPIISTYSGRAKDRDQETSCAHTSQAGPTDAIPDQAVVAPPLLEGTSPPAPPSPSGQAVTATGDDHAPFTVNSAALTQAQAMIAKRIALRERLFLYLQQTAIDRVALAPDAYNALVKQHNASIADERKEERLPTASDAMTFLGYTEWNDLVFGADLLAPGTKTERQRQAKDRSGSSKGKGGQRKT